MPIPDYDENSLRDEHEQWVGSLSKTSKCEPLETLPLNTPILPDRVRFVCVSDSCEKFGDVLGSIPDGDVLIHAGNFTHFGGSEAIKTFNEQLGRLPHRVKIVVAGNHELGFDCGDTGKSWRSSLTGKGTYRGFELLTNGVYLHDTAVKIFGLLIYGSSWHSLPGYPFYRARGNVIAAKWSKIPENVDVLVTHSPPLGYLDEWRDGGAHKGCAELLKNIQARRRPPAFHVFGHALERNGVVSDGRTSFVNATICGYNAEVKNPPVIFDFLLKEGVQKKLR